jgi:hypothetical protein
MPHATDAPVSDKDIETLVDFTQDLLSILPASNQKFAEILETLYAALDLPAPAFDELKPLDPLTFKLVLGSVEFELMFVPYNEEAEQVLVICDYGPLPAQQGLETLSRLMDANFMLFLHGTACCYYSDPDTGNVKFGYRLPLDTLTADRLLNSLNAVSEQALSWRKTFFLQDDAPAEDSFSRVSRKV